MHLPYVLPLFLKSPRKAGTILRLLSGLREFKRSGITPPSAYKALLELFSQTNGHSNDVLHSAMRRENPPAALPLILGPLGEPTPADITAVVDEIRQNGYCVAPRRVPGELLNSLEQFAKVTPAKLRTPKDGHAGPCVYDAQHPVAASYRFTEGQLVNNAAVQALMADAYLLAVAQEYLECIPIFDIVAMWWNVRSDATQADLEELAQLYHFDMDRIKWLKVMIYVTDVDTASGPHCFIKGSHRSGSQPLAIRKRGYVRITDEELAQYFDEDSFREIVGSRGTIIFVDTRGYHKGKPPISNDRLLLEFSLCDSMFGGAFQAPKMAIKNENLKQMAAQVPHIYSRLDIA